MRQWGHRPGPVNSPMKVDQGEDMGAARVHRCMHVRGRDGAGASRTTQVSGSGEAAHEGCRGSSSRLRRQRSGRWGRWICRQRAARSSSTQVPRGASAPPRRCSASRQRAPLRPSRRPQARSAPGALLASPCRGGFPCIEAAVAALLCPLGVRVQCPPFSGPCSQAVL